MAKDSIAEYATDPASNADIAGLNIAEGCAPSVLNNAIRTIMAHLAVHLEGRQIGQDIQAQSSNLAALAELTLGANKLPYATGVGAMDLADLSEFARTLLDDQDATEARATLGVAYATQGEAQAGVNETSFMTPQRTLQAIQAQTVPGFGGSQTWRSVNRSANTSYQNTTGRPIQVAVRLVSSAGRDLQISVDGSSWVTVAESISAASYTATAVVPDQHYYRVVGSTAGHWAELR